MSDTDRATLKLWAQDKYKLSVEEAEVVEDQAKYNPEAVPMVLRFKARVTIRRAFAERIAEAPA